MNSLIICLALLVATTLALVPYETHREVIRGSYIIVLQDGVANRHSRARALLKEKILDIDPVNEITAEWDIINGFSARLSKDSIHTLRRMDDTIALIEEDGVMHAMPSCNSNQAKPRSWGLERVSATSCGAVPSQYSLPSSPGSGTRNYILDTGVRCTHNEFSGGRAVAGRSFISGENACADGNGHGTHVAGTVGGNTVGIARSGTIVDVKVLSRSGSGSTSGVVGGVDFAASDAQSNNVHCSSSNGCKSTANMSLGGGASSALDNAVNNANSKGLLMVVAAGNDNRDACSYSPARASGAFTVVASDINQRRSSFSNYGTCTNIIAPGTSIYSATGTSNSAYSTLSGTSMASPHVAGVSAVIVGASRYTSTSAVKSAVAAQGNKDCITNANGVNIIASVCN